MMRVSSSIVGLTLLAGAGCSENAPPDPGAPSGSSAVTSAVVTTAAGGSEPASSTSSQGNTSAKTGSGPPANPTTAPPATTSGGETHQGSDSQMPNGSTTSSVGATSSSDVPSGAGATDTDDQNPSSATTDTVESETTGPSTDPTFLLGADISSLPEILDAGATFVDTDGQTKTIFELLKNHGFNAVRLRTFVDPGAPYGYAEGTGGTCRKAEPYNDAAHTAEFGAQVKAAGMKLLVDFHYSDTWADPGKQIIPEAWRDAQNIDQMAAHVRDYTTQVLEQLVAAGSKPDMVQVGNETTPGMLIHVPGPNTDCWGNDSVVNSGVTGQASNDNWDNLAKLLDAGADAVHAIDPEIQVVLHIENTDELEGVRWWVNGAVSRDVSFDVLGLSAYTAFQGQPSVWQNTLQTMAEEFPALKFIIAEYNPERTQANRIVKGLPDARGLGTFFWEPTQGGSWGESMFTQSGNVYTARAADFAEYDALRDELGL